MKHVKVLSSSKPANAEQTAWVELKNLVSVFTGLRPLSARQSEWVATQWDDFFQK
jgi:hypothetical protein